MAYDPSLFNVNPYYDDYDEDKQFLRVLFRPGFGLQARELTQVQTILQTQVQRFGDHIFENGSKVVGGEVNDQDVKFLRIKNITGTSSVTAAFEDATIFNHAGTTGQKAKVIKVLEATTSDNFSILFYKELNGNTGAHGEVGFTTDNVLTATASNDNTATVQFTITGHVAAGPTITGTSIGTAKLVGTNPGIRYVDGYFVKSLQQQIPLFLEDSASVRVFDDLTTKVGYNVKKTIVSSTDDSSLTDPANGFYNYAAPGADRFKVDLELSNISFDPSSTAVTGPESNFIEIYRLENDVVTKREKYPDYSFILDTLARRTYDESGNYSIRDFDLNITGGAVTSLTASLGPGKAYVLGYEIETISPTDLTLNKAISTAVLADDSSISTNMGNFSVVTFPTGATINAFGESLDFETHPTVILATGNDLSVGTATTSVTGAAGHARLRQIGVEDSSTDPKKFRAYLYDISMRNDIPFSDVTHIFREGGGATAPIFSLTGSTGNLTASDENKLLFEVPNVEAMKNITDLEIHFKRTRYFTNLSSGEKTFSRSDFGINDSNVTFAGTDSVSAIPNNTFSVAFERDGTVLAGNGQRNADGSQASIDLTDTGITSAYVVANMKINSIDTIRTKTLTTKTLTNQRLDPLGITNTEKFGFFGGDVDVFDIISITGQTASGVDFSVTDYFTLDTGQRDNMYDWSRFVLKDQFNELGLTAIDITYRHFARSGDEGPFIVNSYSGLSTSAIPEYTSPNSGVVTRLANVIDFRPDRDSTGFTFGSSPTASNVTGSASNAQALIPTREIETSTVEGSFYLPRVDKVVLSKDRNFKIVEGVPSITPREPTDLPDAMTLFTVDVNADTRNGSDLTIQKQENRRYTMRDIGEIEKRVEDLEYFTKLSLEEESAVNAIVLGADGTEQFKNGILVDSFEGHNVGDVLNDHYKAAIDFEEGELRPTFESRSVDFTPDSTYTAGITNSGGSVLTLNYTTEKYINQIFANTDALVNPLANINFIGTMVLTPSSDTWYDDGQRPEVLTNQEGQNDAWKFNNNSFGFGTRFNDWKATWFGLDNRSRGKFIQRLARRGVGIDGLRNFFSLVAKLRKKGRFRIRRSKPNTIFDTNLGKRIEKDVVRFIRSKTITVVARGMKPNTVVHPFFSGVDVSSNCTPNGGTLGGTLTTDANGSITLTFAIPAATFRQGKLLFRLIDDSSNNSTNATTVAEKLYVVQGFVSNQDSNILSTREIDFQRETVKDERIFEDAKSKDNTRPGLNDPVAQLFSVQSYAYSAGLFVESVDLYFREKGDELPVTVQIRPVINGYPSPSKVLPFATATVNADSVTTTTTMDPNSATNFKFESPVYLSPGEYCIVVQTNDSKHKLWVGEEGEYRINTTDQVIGKQPYVGGLFESQNASSREENKIKSLAFRINKCKFTGRSQSEGNRLITLKSDGLTTDYGTTTLLGHEYHVNVSELKLPTTAISYQQKTKKTAGGSFESAVDTEVNDTIKFPDRLKREVDPDAANEIQLLATMSSDSDHVSPVIDVDRLNMILIENKINAQQDKIELEKFATPVGATSSELPLMRYITRQVNLEPGFESTDLKVTLEQHRPNTTSNIFVLAKVLGDDSGKFEEQSFIKMNAATAQASTIQGEDEFISVDYTLTAGTITGNNFPFDKFAVKVVMYDSTNSVDVPKVRNLTAIAHGAAT
jgi:hypothetical protein